ncbi:MAG: sugar phosphate nucleotidyltransferase [Candidatus Micrarchaeota archaeon]|nr:sugar phosphate nucleotidyltransferase [Candidatus Micrarchaeota archaeon]
MKGVILAGGNSTRLHPVTEDISKCLLPVGGKAIIDYLLGHMDALGIAEIGIVVSDASAASIKEHVGSSFGNAKITYLNQDAKAKGSAAAVQAAIPFIGKDEALIVAGDIVVDFQDVKEVVGFHKRHKIEATMLVATVADPRRYGIVELHEKKVFDIIEKPAEPKSSLANASVYVVGRRFIDEIKRVQPSQRGELEITSALYEMCNEGLLYAIPAKGYWNDIGTPWDLLAANEHYMGRIRKRVEGTVKDSTIIGNAVIEKGAHVLNSYVEGPCYISKGAVVGPFAHIRKYTYIGPGVEVGGFSIVKNSILLGGTKAKHLTYIGDSIIGHNCNFGSSTQLANLRFDRKAICMSVNGKEYDTGRNKLGCVVGPNVNFGVNSVVLPGKKIGGGSIIGPGVIVADDVPPKTRVLARQNIEHTPIDTG